VKTTFVLPAELVPAGRSPKAPAPGEPVRAHNPMCFGCGDRSPAGLHMKAIAGEGTDVTARMQVEPRFEGGPGVIHGGILSTAFDEVMGLTHWMVGAIAVTAHLEVDFAKPIPVGSELRLEAETIGTVRRKLYSRADAYLGDDTEPVGAAHAIFVQIKPLEHFKDSFEASAAAEFYGERIARHDPGSSSV
jgi:acyl-coenzyme A thioesterase PaaI-like protein